MHTQHRHLPLYGTLAAALLIAAGAAAPAVADPLPPTPMPIGPHEYFTGAVNGVSSNSGRVAQIDVVCPGPETGDRTGHPVAGQTVAVAPAASTDGGSVGNTGPGNRIMVDFGLTTINSPIVFSTYSQVEIPTTQSLPCSGQSKVAFNPVPVGDTTFSAYVVVNYVNIAD
jgi:hypothetical protein